MPHVYCCFFILESFYNIKDVFFDLLNMFRVNKGSDFADQLHKYSNSVCADEREGNSKVRVIFVKSNLLEMFLDPFINFVGDLTQIEVTAFSGRKRKSLKISMKRVPKGMISMMARI